MNEGNEKQSGEQNEKQSGEQNKKQSGEQNKKQEGNGKQTGKSDIKSDINSDIIIAGRAIYESIQDIKSTLNSTNYSLVVLGHETGSVVTELIGIDNKFKDLNSILRDIRDELHIANIIALYPDIDVEQGKAMKLLSELDENIVRERKDNKKKRNG